MQCLGICASSSKIFTADFDGCLWVIVLDYIRESATPFLYDVFRCSYKQCSRAVAGAWGSLVLAMRGVGVNGLVESVWRGWGTQSGEIEKWATKAFELCFRVIFGLWCLSLVSGVGLGASCDCSLFWDFPIS